jgi:hypothetical protein
MCNIRNSLSSSGSLIIEVPDASRYCEMKEFVFWREHINHFDKYSLINLGKRYGFTTFDVVEGINRTHKDSCPIPVILIVFRVQDISIDKNNICTGKIKKYISKLQKSYNTVENRIKNLIETEENIAIWGAGAMLSTILASTNIRNCKIDFIVDIDVHKQGENIAGYPIYNPVVLRDYKGTILIFKSTVQQSILKTIAEMGLKNKIYAL